MNFDDLHDPNPPQPGPREFAVVAQRARDIRRRRASVVVWTTCILLVVVGVVGISGLVNDGGSDGAVATTPIVSTPAEDTDEPSTTASTPSTSSTTIEQEPLPLRDASTITSLPTIEWTGGPLLVGGAPAFEISRAPDGSICAAPNEESEPVCQPPGAGIYVVDLQDTATSSTQETDPQVAIFTDRTVTVNFLTVGVECASVVTTRNDVAAWLCDGLDVDTATIEVRGDGLVLIATPPER